MIQRIHLSAIEFHDVASVNQMEEGLIDKSDCFKRKYFRRGFFFEVICNNPDCIRKGKKQIVSLGFVSSLDYIVILVGSTTEHGFFGKCNFCPILTRFQKRVGFCDCEFKLKVVDESLERITVKNKDSLAEYGRRWLPGKNKAKYIRIIISCTSVEGTVHVYNMWCGIEKKDCVRLQVLPSCRADEIVRRFFVSKFPRNKSWKFEPIGKGGIIFEVHYEGKVVNGSTPISELKYPEGAVFEIKPKFVRIDGSDYSERNDNPSLSIVKDSAYFQRMEKVLNLRKLLTNKKFEDLLITEPPLGRGAYGTTYLCKVKGMDGKYVVKFYNEDYLIDEEDDEVGSIRKKKLKKIRKGDSLYLQYHPNVVSILSHSDKVSVDFSKLPEYFQDSVTFFEKKEVPMVIMEYHREDLEKFILRKLRDREYLSPEEVLDVLKGLILGVQHLHINKVVHRDLHPSNVLIDEEGVYICDFGCALDLHKNTTGFRVHKDEEVLFSVMYSDIRRFGGAKEYLPPEVRNSNLNGTNNDEKGKKKEEEDDWEEEDEGEEDEDEGEEDEDEVEEEEDEGEEEEYEGEEDEVTKDFVDYEKCDIYSVGVIGRLLLSVTGDEYEWLDTINSINELCESLTEEDPKERFDFNTALRGIEDIRKQM